MKIALVLSAFAAAGVVFIYVFIQKYQENPSGSPIAAMTLVGVIMFLVIIAGLMALIAALLGRGKPTDKS